jgi:hypothetical protein
MRLIVCVAFLGFCAVPAHAAIEDYCEAYAIDFANLERKDRERWQTRHDNAKSDCLLRYSAAAPEPAAKPAEKPKSKAAEKPVPKPVAKPKLPKPAPVVEEKVAAAIPKLKPGSPQWTAYCKKKYTSFNVAKGTYTSKTGIERKCLVTAN